jgi:murein DD-endopeptidase MepM/ murein hydrolase activator NlpD
MFQKRYYLDDDLLYKHFKLTLNQKIIHIFLLLIMSTLLIIVCNNTILNTRRSIKEKALKEKIELLKMQYAYSDKKINELNNKIDNLKFLDITCYRPIFNMDTLTNYTDFLYSKPDDYIELEGYNNSKIMIDLSQKVEKLNIKTFCEYKSYEDIYKESLNWKERLKHLPMISPVNTELRQGDGIKFRVVHPVLGIPMQHRGQDFAAPIGTEVHATGDGIIIYAGWNAGGFGNCIVINHGYGFVTIYGHLSKINIKNSDNIKRGDVIGLVGTTGISTGPHLHYQIDFYSQYKNPLDYFNNDLTGTEYDEMIKILNENYKN